MDGMTALYISKWVYLIAIFLVIVGGINWGLFGLIKFDLVKWLGVSLRMPVLSKIIYIMVGISALYLAFDRNTYLPFLGETVYPCTGLADKVPDNATVSISVKVPPGVKVVYWASERSNDANVAPNPWVAYMNYENSGVVTANKEGVAVLKLREPTEYKVPTGKKLRKHVHYRYCRVPGMLSKIQTAFL
jgi:uncharacterized membrane protein YuzA (DUF378 family)